MVGPRPLRSTDPRRIGAHELLALLGEGGQGTVFLARDAQGVEVAVKLLRAGTVDDPHTRRLLEREVAAVGRVASFCTARILAAHLDGDAPHLVSEYIPGPSLQDFVAENGPLPGDALDRLAIGSMTALAAIHEAGVVHRDFKPGNVLLGPDGPRVIDFGVARPLDGTTLTASRTVGTPAYMSPEQLSGERAAAPMDMWAWACTMVFAATGRLAFPGRTAPEVITQIVTGTPDLGGLAGGLRELVAACFTRDPAARPRASDVLLRLLGGSVKVGDLLSQGAAAATTQVNLPYVPVTQPPTQQRRGRQRGLLLGSAVGAAVVLAAAAGTVLLLPSPGKSHSSGRSNQHGSAPVVHTQPPTTVAASCTYLPAAGGQVKSAPTPPANPARATTATLATTQGTITVRLAADRAPCTVNSFVSLARAGFYGNTLCHRLTTDATLKVLQCGDPSGTGAGGPPYRFANENATETFHRGDVAMANAGADATNGSQFFLVAADTQRLGSGYSLFGTITGGLDVLDREEQAGTSDGGTDGHPKLAITLRTVTVA